MSWKFERERIKALTQQSSERLAVHFLQTPVGIIEWNLNFQVVEWNPAAERILGLRRVEAIGKHASTFFMAEDYAVVEKLWKELIKTGEDGRYSCRNLIGEGQEIWCHWANTPLRDDRGSVMAILSLIEDITSRRRIEHSLYIHASAIRTAITPTAMFDPKGRLTYVNNAFVDQWGCGGYLEAVGRRLEQFLQGPEGVESVLAELAKGGRWVGELKGCKRDGNLFDVKVSANVARNKDGTALCMMASLADITERKKTEAEIRKLNAELDQRVIERTAELKKAYQELEAFSYSVSHDLRAPLRRINGFSVLLDEEHSHKLDAQAQDYLKRIRATTVCMEALIDDLLSLSQVTRVEIKRQEIDLGELAEAVAGDLKNSDLQRQVRFVHPGSLFVRADPGLMRIVIENLLGNAWKFTVKKQDITIELGVLAREERNIFFVRDNGAGFDQQYADKLFGAFQRLHSSEEFQGSGIGLAIVQRIIHRHGGRVWAEGIVDRGATFFFTLSDG